MKYLITAIALFTAFSGMATEDETPVKSKINEVTVFIQGAQVNRTASVSLKTGTNHVVFENLSPHIDPNSIQVQGDAKFTILSVNHRQNYLEEAASLQKTKDLLEKKETLALKISMRESMRRVYVEERSMILDNKKLSGKDESMLVEDLMELANFYRSRLKEIEFKILEIDQEIKLSSEEVVFINQQLNELNYKKGKNTGEVVIQVTSKSSSTVKMEISFLVKEAGWVPEYDVRSSDVGGPVTLTYKGRIWQNSGNDWDKIKIRLNTGNPSKNNTQPEVFPWVLDFQQQLFYSNMNSNASYDYATTETKGLVGGEGRKRDEERYDTDDVSLSLANYTSVTQGNVAAEFVVKVPYTIPSNGQQYAVEVQDFNLPVAYNYFAAPKVDNDAFLLARVTGWDELNLLSGTAHVYYQGTFVGNSYLNTATTNDTLDVSLGRDKGIVVNRKKVDDFSKTTISGGIRKTSVGIKIEVRNNKPVPVSITVEDQVPLTQQKEIEVDMLEEGGAVYNEQTGKLTWKIELQPGESKAMEFRYQVKYPKNQVIQNL